VVWFFSVLLGMLSLFPLVSLICAPHRNLRIPCAFPMMGPPPVAPAAARFSRMSAGASKDMPPPPLGGDYFLRKTGLVSPRPVFRSTCSAFLALHLTFVRVPCNITAWVAPPAPMRYGLSSRRIIMFPLRSPTTRAVASYAGVWFVAAVFFLFFKAGGLLPAQGFCYLRS